jgi:hypothetical protein
VPSTTTHNIDRFISDLRLILSQGRKRIGLLVGAGGPFSIKVGKTGKITHDGEPLIPSVFGLTTGIVGSLTGTEKVAVDAIVSELGADANIEGILSRIRLLANAIGPGSHNGLSGAAYAALGSSICDQIGKLVGAKLPDEPNPYLELIGWISGTVRQWPIEVFTTNYDLLFEEAFERSKIPYFDGFTGSNAPFFDGSSVATDDMPSRWARLWKLHGSLGWAISGEAIIRGCGRSATQLIYPDHLKYDQIRKLPYSAFFERMRRFLLTPDSLLVTCGFSFMDAHVNAVLDEALATNANTAIFAFQYQKLADECAACALARIRPNLSVYASDGAVIRGVEGRWYLGELPNKEWGDIRRTFWGARGSKGPEILTLGDFVAFCKFIALSQATNIELLPSIPVSPAPSPAAAPTP